ncbi:MAG: TolB amino-terminal protein, partial [Verrucomicrobia bacterium]|nr:TolB amino-terminal protein [Verrucomicrobiota bacterium]
MSESSKAVFLSYAREDAEAARRIADALRSQGVEVWFDQNELRGGDAWDAKIRRQIKECALFVPIVSTKTQERGEGYFRLEWKLAVERTHLMAEGVPFLSPVVIDDTKDAGAVVPAEFTRVQWTRLPGALPTPQFVEQVKRLLESPRRPFATHAREERAEDSGTRQSRGPRAPWIAAAAVIVVTLALIWFRNRAPDSVPVVTEKIPVPAAPTAPVVSDKSIAVLPFTNMSDEKDNTFFTDGMHEDILTNLALIHELRVVSRTSVMQYRETKKSIRQIASELGVAYILEGSVRRAGNKVRVTGQLINARTDEHVWAQSYDRDLTDIFAIQSALSQEIAKALSAALSPQEKDLLARRPTNNPAAYDLFLKARQIGRDGNDTLAELTMEQALLESATTLDPSFAGAWAALSEAHAEMVFNFFDTSKVRLAKARAAIDAALKLEPDSPDVMWGAGNFYYYGTRDYPRALEYFERLARQSPNNPFGVFACGLVERRQGKWVEALAKFRQAERRDPASPEIARNIVISLRSMRRFDEAIAAQEIRVRLVPESLRESFELARIHYFATGS